MRCVIQGACIIYNVWLCWATITITAAPGVGLRLAYFIDSEQVPNNEGAQTHKNVAEPQERRYYSCAQTASVHQIHKTRYHKTSNSFGLFSSQWGLTHFNLAHVLRICIRHPQPNQVSFRLIFHDVPLVPHTQLKIAFWMVNQRRIQRWRGAC